MSLFYDCAAESRANRADADLFGHRCGSTIQVTVNTIAFGFAVERGVGLGVLLL